MPVEELEAIWRVIEGGAEVAAENIIQLPVDVAEAGAEVAQGVTHTVTVGNGAAAEVTELAVIEGGAATGTTTGLAVLSAPLPTAVLAAAPIFGLIGGAALYNLAPEFWTNLSNALVQAGQTVGGKIRLYLNGQTKTVGMSQQTLEIIKNALLEAGCFSKDYDIPSTEIGFTVTNWEWWGNGSITAADFNNAIPYPSINTGLTVERDGERYPMLAQLNKSSDQPVLVPYMLLRVNNEYKMICGAINYTGQDAYTLFCILNGEKSPVLSGTFSGYRPKINGSDGWGVAILNMNSTQVANYITQELQNFEYSGNVNVLLFSLYANITENFNPDVQEGATVPNTDPFPNTYPNYTPWTPPAGVPWPQELPDIYPVELPANNPDPSQAEAQDPDPLPALDPIAEWIIDNLPLPAPNPNPEPVPVPEPDPDPQPDPEPIPEPDPAEVDPDPPNPNPEPDPSIDPVFPVVPTGVDSNAMFTVYNPSLSQLNAFGRWLWSTNIITQILQMWQNPLDGIIAFMKVYATPSVGSTALIQVGYLESTAAAPIVTSQFTTIDCGSVNVPEDKHNATDYTPYTSIHIYLPFIGIVELDPDEIMNGSVNVKYHVDVYTGSCLCEVRITRSEDMPSGAVLYTFTGNCAQQLPLTSASFAGVLSAIVTAGVAIGTGGSGGALVSAAKMGAVGHSLTHDMVHIGHSGSLTANAGIMGARKPYIIIGRRHGYDANGYNELYGFPANKTVYLGNCSGYTRIKAGRLRTKASEDEKKEIMSLLMQGVIL